MTRIASLFVAAALLLTAAPSFAQDSTPSVRSQAYAVAMALTEVERGLQTARVELNKAWAEARTIKGELSEWRAGDQVTSDEGQERIRVLGVHRAMTDLNNLAKEGLSLCELPLGF